MIRYNVKDSREEWLKARGMRIGGSDAACLLGLNPWKSNVQLWNEKMHPESVENIDNEAMAYGRAAEPVIRELFAIEHKNIKVVYEENNLWLNDDLPFAHASLDGWWVDGTKNGITGVIEIKTVTIRNSTQASEWIGRIPDNYYCQVLWYMMVTNAQEAWLTALMHFFGGRREVRDYYITRDDSQVENDISCLVDAGEKFWKSLQEGKEPALILPQV